MKVTTVTIALIVMCFISYKKWCGERRVCLRLAYLTHIVDHFKYLVIALEPLLTQQGWDVLPPFIITTRIEGSIQILSVESLKNLNIPNQKIHKLMETLSQIAIKYLTHIILNRRKLEKKLPSIMLD